MGSPGLNILYISNSASFLFLVLSIVRVFLINLSELINNFISFLFNKLQIFKKNFISL